MIFSKQQKIVLGVVLGLVFKLQLNVSGIFVYGVEIEIVFFFGCVYCFCYMVVFEDSDGL